MNASLISKTHEEMEMQLTKRNLEFIEIQIAFMFFHAFMALLVAFTSIVIGAWCTLGQYRLQKRSEKGTRMSGAAKETQDLVDILVAEKTPRTKRVNSSTVHFKSTRVAAQVGK